MTGRPTFSVVVAAYQAADTVLAAVRSALDQTVPPLEVVVCDDGSTDGTSEALAPVADRITLLRQDNAGEGAAKNAAARAARGDFVVVLDADDLFAPTRIEALESLAVQRPDLDILATDAWVVDEATGTRRRCYGPSFRFATDDQPTEILRRNFILGLAAVRRSALLAAGGYDAAIRVTTDWHLWIRMITAGSRAGLVDEPLATYRLRPDSLSADPVRLLAGRLETLRAVRCRLRLDPARAAVLDDTIRRHEAELTRSLARRALAAGARDARRRSLAVVGGPGQPLASRLKAAVAVVAPRLARRGAGAGEAAAAGGFRAAGQPPQSR